MATDHIYNMAERHPVPCPAGRLRPFIQMLIQCCYCLGLCHFSTACYLLCSPINSTRKVLWHHSSFCLATVRRWMLFGNWVFQIFGWLPLITNLLWAIGALQWFTSHVWYLLSLVGTRANVVLKCALHTKYQMPAILRGKMQIARRAESSRYDTGQRQATNLDI